MRLVYEPLTEIPKGFTEVEYLESTGTQYIDTGLTSLDVDTVFESTFAVRSVPSSGNYLYGADSILTGLQGNKIAFTQITAVANTFYKTKLVYTVGEPRQIYVNDEYIGTASNYHAIFAIRLFSLDSSRQTIDSFLIKRTKITMEGVLVRDFVPCLDNNNVPCMYDKVEGKAYYNAGTGTFSYGRKIIPVEYLESTGQGAYIKTGITANFNTKAEVLFVCNELVGSPAVLGGRVQKDSAAFCIWGKSSAGYVCCNFSNTGVFDSDVTAEANTKYLAVLDSSGYAINGSKTSITTTTTFTSPELYLFDANGANTSTSGTSNRKLVGKIYYVKIYDNDTLVRDYIPVKDENNVGYMFDRVNHILYANAGTGSFIYKDYEEPIELINNPKYQQVEYLESSGTQYINTGVTGNNPNLKIEVDATTYEFGWCHQTVASGAWVDAFSFPSDNKERVNYGNYSSVKDFNYDRITRKIRTFDFKTGFYIDGVLGQSFTISNYSSLTPSLSLFARYDFNSSSYTILANSSYKIYGCKIYDNNTIVRNFIPAIRKSDNKPGMYDKVSGNFYINAGTDEFLYGSEVGPLPKEYEELDYIQSSGTQYIDSGIKPNTSTSVLYSCAVIGNITNKDSHLFGSRLSATSQAFDLAYMNTAGNGYETLRFISGTNYKQVQSPLVTATTIKNKNSYYMTSTKVSVNDTDILTFTTSSYQGTYSLWLFGVNNAGTLHNQVIAQNVYGCKIWDGNILVRDFVPCYKKVNGEAGMYDRVTKQFFGNSGTGTFVKGEKAKVLRNKICRLVGGTGERYVDGYRRVDYLQSTRNQYFDTGISFPNGFRVKGKVSFNQVSPSCAVFGSWGSSSPYYRNFFGISQLGFYTGFGGSSYQYFGTASTNVDYTFNVRNVIGKEYLELNGTPYPLNIEGTEGTYTSTSAYIFAFHKGSGAGEHGYEKLYWLKAYDENDNLVGDYFPVLDENDEPCLYDNVSKSLLKNKTTTDFTYENILEGNINRIIYSGI